MMNRKAYLKRSFVHFSIGKTELKSDKFFYIWEKMVYRLIAEVLAMFQKNFIVGNFNFKRKH